MKHTHKRSGFISIVLFSTFALLMLRLIYLQVFNQDLVSYAKVQHEALQKLVPMRGSIFDRNGIPLAMSKKTYTVKVVPAHLKKNPKGIETLHQILGVDHDQLRERIHTSDKKAIYVKRHIEDETLRRLQEEKIPGLYFDNEHKRLYPKGSLASHVIGFVGVEGQGQEGIEAVLDESLSGDTGYRSIAKDGKSRELLAIKRQTRVPRDGYDVFLTIDEHIQYVVEREMDQVFKKYKPKGMSVVVVDPYTGEIVSLANRPHFNPNEYGQSEPGERRNRAVTEIFEPGSTFKAMTFAAGMNEDCVVSTDKIYCENGKYRVKGRRKPLHDHKPHKWLSVQEILQKSSNIGTVKIAQKLGSKRLYDYISLFGFGKKTGVSFHGEASGLLRSHERWSPASIAAIPIGQEIGTTAIQMVMGVSAIANKGVLMSPMIIKELRHKNGETIARFEPESVRRVVDEEVAMTVAEMMETVVDPQGTARRAAISGVRVAGKTGTAQKYDPQTKTYSKRKYVASFIGFFPVEAPRYCIGVFVDEPPYSVRYGGVIAAPLFQKIGQDIMHYRDE